MMRKVLALFFVLLLAGGMSACAGCDDDDNNDNNVQQDTGMDVENDVEEDTGMDTSDDTGMDTSDDTGMDTTDDTGTDAGDTSDTEDDDADAGTLGPDPAASAQIETVLGGTNETIEQVAVTYTKPNVGGDAAGFFVQAEQTGPALFVEVDPTAVDPDIVKGDILTFDVTATDSSNGINKATSIENIDYLASGYDVSQLAQDVSDATDLVSALDDYTAELLTADVEVVDDFGFAGSGHDAAQVETAGITGNAELLFRVPSDFLDTYGLQNTCTLTVGPTPMWRFNADAQLSAYFIEDISNVNCPAPTVTGASATSATEVRVTFDRVLDDSTVAAAEFTIADDGGTGLNVSGATVTDNVVTLTTDSQTEGANYTVTVSDNVQDVFGAAVDQSANTADFLGYAPPATVVINEFNGGLDSAALGGGCDLLEIRVLSGGSLDGFQLYERETSILTFQNLIVQTNDYIVVHFDDADCNDSGSTNETSAPDEQPFSAHLQNFDTAYDWYTSETTLTDTDNVLWLANPAGDVADAVWADDTSDAANCSSASVAGSSVGAAQSTAAASEWLDTAGGTLPSSGLTDEEFCNNAVLGLKDTGALRAGDSIQRSGDVDNNHKGDWGLAAGTWGENNAGQTDQ